jgi:hypothetical protein
MDVWSDAGTVGRDRNAGGRCARSSTCRTYAGKCWGVLQAFRFVRDFDPDCLPSCCPAHRCGLPLPFFSLSLSCLSIGLGALVEEFRDSAARLKQNVLFLGPERLFQPPADPSTTRTASCFIVMPFSQKWSADFHLLGMARRSTQYVFLVSLFLLLDPMIGITQFRQCPPRQPNIL